MIRSQITKFTKILCHENLELYGIDLLNSVTPPITISDIPMHIDVDEACFVGIGGNSLTHVFPSLRLNISS